MKVGDLVKRKCSWKDIEYSPKLDENIGIVISLQSGGRNPVHPCATIFYSKVNKRYDIAVSLLEVLSASR